MVVEPKRTLRIPIARKITIVVAIPFILLAAFSIPQTRWRLGANLHNQLRSKGEAIAKALASSSEERLVSGNVESLQALLDGFRDVDDVGYLYVTDNTNELIAHTFAIRPPAAVAHRQSKSPDKEIAFTTLTPPELGEHLEVAAPVLFGTLGTVHVGMSTKQLEAELKSATVSLLLQFVVAVFIAILLLAVAVRILLRPLHRVLAVLRKTGTGDLTQTVGALSNDELGDLGQEVDSARARLAIMIARIRQAYGNIQASNSQVTALYEKIVEVIDRQAKVASATSQAASRTNEMATRVTTNTLDLDRLIGTSAAATMQLGASAHAVSEQTDLLFRSVEEAGQALAELTSAIDEIHRNLARVSQGSDETASAMSEMGTSATHVRMTAENTVTEATLMHQLAEQGLATSHETIGGLRAIRESSEQVSRLTATLNQRIEEIDGILKFITEITGKTNLLALNAAIIASQAGAQGKGFGVVATEMKELADRTNAQTQRIGEVIEGIRQEVTRTENAVRVSKTKVDSGVLLAEETGHALERIVSNSNQVAGRVQGMARATTEQAATAERVTRTTEGLALLVANIMRAGQKQAASAQRIFDMATSIQRSADHAKHSTREQHDAAGAINRDLANISEASAAIAAAMQEQGESSGALFAVTEQLNGTVENNRESVLALKAVFQTLAERVVTLNDELRSFNIRQESEDPQ